MPSSFSLARAPPDTAGLSSFLQYQRCSINAGHDEPQPPVLLPSGEHQPSPLPRDLTTTNAFSRRPLTCALVVPDAELFFFFFLLVSPRWPRPTSVASQVFHRRCPLLGFIIAAEASLAAVDRAANPFRQQNPKLCSGSELEVQADCSIWDMEVNQTLNEWVGRIPVFQVVVRNLCNIPDGCPLGNIHMTCGDFNTSLPVDPLKFRLLSFNDCLLVDGGDTYGGDVIFFKYAHPGRYPMTISSVTCFPKDP
ncbi:hypothetical protein ZIOFF_056737 [Zingiber officinale]|uniref:Uncharacterized protein n=1 Tax=Zingiber officinale TaxID=94328 RepID=A0A8J5FE69_ZINOF|nr:hypothetical protein ZIOFF_056737 [Zingiber officinale]